MNRWIVHICFYTALLGASLLLSFLSIGVLYKDNPLQLSQPQTLVIHQEDNAFTIADKLKTEGIVPYRWVFLATFIVNTIDDSICPKTIHIKPSDTYRGLIQQLQAQP